MKDTAFFALARRQFHAALLQTTLTRSPAGVVSNADGSSVASKKIANGIAEQLQAKNVSHRIAGQTAGSQFEAVSAEFVRKTFQRLTHLRPGKWTISHITSRNRLQIAQYQQFLHLVALAEAARTNRELAAALGSDYTITPDIIVSRKPEPDSVINEQSVLVNDTCARFADLREVYNSNELLHASISCKWTIRSDRAQNARSEALNLIRNRKGHLPHIMVVTAEPMPSRISSIALGTGDIDCVYHFALYELQETIKSLGMEDALDTLDIMVRGNRLKDISDLPLDLAV